MSKEKIKKAGNFTLDLEEQSLNNGTENIYLSPKEVKIMALLMDNAGKTVSRKTLMKEVWDINDEDDTRTLDVHIRWLRQKVEEFPRIPEHILTRRGQGYELRL